jgi:sugar phosphate isomerase/epimerase
MSTAAPSRALSLAHLTLLGLAPADLIDVAARAGYPFVGLRLLPAAPGGPAYPLMNDAVALRETLARMAASGVRVFDLEIVRLDERFDVARLLPLLEVGARLGARTVLVGADDTDAARRARSYAALCEAARGFGLAACIEFMPWTAVKNLRDATQLIEMAGRPANAGLLVDALHFARSQSTLHEVAALPREWLHYAQICDAPAEIPASVDGLIHTARAQRQLPGEGGIDLVGLLRALPGDLPLSVEVPDPQRAAAVGPRAWAEQALQAARAVLAQR